MRTARPISAAAFVSAVVAALFAAATMSARAAHPASLSHLVDRTAAAHPNALWHIVHSLCVTDMKASGAPAPCARVNLAGGYAVLKDIQGTTQFLLIPTARLTGIESRELLAPGSPNYWQGAWGARDLFDRQVGHPVPRQDVGLAINSFYGRTQNQLHIHIDCVQPPLVQAVAAAAPQLTSHWSTLKTGPHGRVYRARWIDGENLGGHDPFKLLASRDAATRADMARQTLVLVGAVGTDGAPGFVLLSDRAERSKSDDGAGEELLDHKCAILAQPNAVPRP